MFSVGEIMLPLKGQVSTPEERGGVLGEGSSRLLPPAKGLGSAVSSVSGIWDHSRN